MLDSSNEIKQLLVQAVAIMEQGTFQEMAYELLPFIDSMYLKPFMIGGTSDGKTRKGTPDILVTADDGSQIAIECSVDKDYWKIPKSSKKYHEWKPCADIDKCFDKIHNLKEVVLFVSRHLPSNGASCYQIISNYCKVRHGNHVKLTYIDGRAIVDKLLELTISTNAHALFQKYFTNVFQIIQSMISGNLADLTLDIYSKKPGATISNIQMCLKKELAKSGFNLKEIQESTLSGLDSLNSIFEKSEMPKLGAIERTINNDFNIESPIGEIVSILGVPKIGKTQLISRFAHKWKDEGLNVKWYECPIQTSFNTQFLQTFIHDLLSEFIPNSIAAEIACKRSPVSIIENIEPINLKQKHSIFIIDNLELLSDSALDSLTQVLSYLKNTKQNKRIGIIFISSHRNQFIATCQSKELLVPNWNPDDLKKIVSDYYPDTKGLKDPKYIDLLHMLSGGHPQIALYLCSKYPNSSAELIVSGIKAPRRLDDGLINQFDNFLLNNILKDSDSLLFTARLANLIHAAPEEMLFIIKDFTPIIKTSIPVLLSQLNGTVIEGNKNDGYRVSLIYKNCAKEMLSATEKKTLFKYVASKLLQIKNNKIDFDNIEQGIQYAVFSENYRLAFDWTNILLMPLFKNTHLRQQKIKIILDRLSFVVHLPVSNDIVTLARKYLALSGLSTLYTKIDCHPEASEIDSKLVIPSDIDNSNDTQAILEICANSIISRVMYKFNESPDAGLRELCQCDIRHIIIHQPKGFTDLLNLISKSIKIFKSQELLEKTLSILISNEDILTNEHINDLVSITQAITILAYKSKSDYMLNTCDNSNLPLQKMLAGIANSIYFNDKNYDDVLVTLEDSKKIAEEKNYLTTEISVTILQLKADCLFEMGEYSRSITTYKESLALLPEKDESYPCGWAYLKIALAVTDLDESLQYLNLASKVFEQPKFISFNAMVQGEISIIHAIRGDYKLFIDVAKTLIDNYYTSGKNKHLEYSCVIALSHIARLKKKLDYDNCDENEESMLFNRMTYLNTEFDTSLKTDELQARLAISYIYSLLNEVELKHNQLYKGIEAITENTNANSIYMIFHELIMDLVILSKDSALADVLENAINIHENQFVNPEYLAASVFSPFDTFQKTGPAEKQSRKNLESLEILNQRIVHRHISKIDWWQSEIYLRIGRINYSLLHDSDEGYLNICRAYEISLSCNNFQVTINAGYDLTMRYINMSLKEWRSLYQISEIHFNMLLCYEHVSKSVEECLKFGDNLFKFYCSFNVRKRTVNDLSTLNYLYDNAKILNKEATSTRECAIIIILLLSALFKHKGRYYNDYLGEINTDKVPQRLYEYIDFDFLNDD